MKMKLMLLSFLATVAGLSAAQPPIKPPPPLAPPPITVAPTPGPATEVETKVITNTVVVTNWVPVTSVTQVTNTILVTNVLPQPEYVYEQRLMGGRPTLVTPEQARMIIDRFKTNYVKMGNPRMLIYVNRELVDEQSGMKLSARTERTEVARNTARGAVSNDPDAVKNTNVVVGNGGATERANNENIYRIQDRPQLTLADRQTVRDVERLFGRPFRLGGVSLVDQRVATQLIGSRPIKAFVTSPEGEQARRDREALTKIADIVLEVLISSRNVTVPEVSGDKTYSVPDIIATAIQLSDSKILGQATAADLIGKGAMAGRYASSYDVRDIAEATALSLMEDMMLGMGQ